MTQEQTDRFKEYLLHYVGSKTYGMRRLLKEAAVKGAQRTVPFRMLNKMHYGDKILLAEHRKIEQIDQATGQKLEPIKMAVCFGYLKIDSMSHNLPDDISKEVLKRLTVDDYKDYSAEGGMFEERACGSYGVAGTAYVREDIDQICQVIQAVCAEKGFSLHGIKFFVRGSVTKFEAPLTLENINFTRGLYMKVRLDSTLLPDLDAVNEHAKKGDRRALYQLYDYKLKAGMTKEDQADYDRALEDEYREAVKD